jgi:hypothetical protein
VLRLPFFAFGLDVFWILPVWAMPPDGRETPS